MLMTRFRTLFVFAGTLMVTAIAGFGAPPADSGLEAALKTMDQASASFKGLTADIKKLAHTQVVNVDDVSEGTITVKRFKAHDTRIRIDFKKPSQQMVAIGGGKAEIYYPKINEVQEGDLGKIRSLVDQLMLLGFGGNSADLLDAYTVTLGGPDTVNGEKATRIVLIPKSKDILQSVKKCELWISEKGLTVQQRFDQGGGDYLLSTYSKINLSASIPESAVRLDIPKGAKRTKLK
jgi:outer membrane lipoprotein-sorting protein